MEGAAGGVLGDLFAAAEAVSDEGGFWGGGADGGEQDALGERLGDFEFVALEAEGAGHAAAAGVEKLDFGAGGREECDFVGHLHDGPVVAVALDDEGAGAGGGVVERGFADEEFAEEQGVGFEFVGAGVVGEEVGELVAEDGGAAWLEDDDGHAGGEEGLEDGEGVEEVSAGGREQAEVVERAAAADVAIEDADAEAGGGKELVRGQGGGGAEVVVEGVGPEEDVACGGGGLGEVFG